MVVRINVTLRGDKEVASYYRKLEKTLPRAGSAVLDRYARFVQRSAKIRASAQRRWAASGKLSQSIDVKREGKNKISVTANARSAIPQELGYKPHYVSIKHLSPRARQAMKEYSFGLTSTGTGSGKKGVIFVRDYTPYFSPAIKKANANIDRWIKDELDKAVR